MKNIIIAAAATTLLAGCSTYDNAPLFFGQTQNVGIAIGVNPATSLPEITVGYEDANIANVPTAIVRPNQKPLLLNGQGEGKEFQTDAFSTFGQFDVGVEQNSRPKSNNDDNDSDASADPATAKIALGKFFATGLAARLLAQGFACEISKGSHSSCEYEQQNGSPSQ